MLRTLEKKKSARIKSVWSRLMKRLRHKTSRQDARKYIRERI